MNKRIQELADEAELYAVSDNSSMLFDVWKKRYTEKFAELIVKECADIGDLYEGGEYQVRTQILAHFGIEETEGWVCPRCGVDRTKNVCPHGYTATIEGKCPMIGVAQ